MKTRSVLMSAGLPIIALCATAVLASCTPRLEPLAPGQGLPDDHDTRFFPTGHGSSENAGGDCNACHGGDSFSQFNCLGCHAHDKATTDTQHAGTSGYSYDSAGCLTCHAGGAGGIPTDHDTRYFPTNHGEAENPSHSCAICHGISGTYTSFDCLGCHAHEKPVTDTEHSQAGSGYGYDSPSCLSCHPMGKGFSPTDHDTKYFPTGHGEAENPNHECATCHTTPGSYKGFDCIGCHAHDKPTSDTEHAPVGSGYGYDSPSCLACHPMGKGFSTADHDTRYFPTGHGAAENPNHDCATCHTTPGSYTVYDCLKCHSHDKGTTDTQHAQAGSGYGYDSPKCLGCHPKGQGLSPADHDAKYFPTAHGAAENPNHACATCHTTPGSYTAYDCLKCHSHDKVATDTAHKTAGGGYTYDSPSCLRCHPKGGPFSVNHGQYFPISSGRHSGFTCADCHPKDYKVAVCISCHTGTHSCASMNSKHRGEGGYTCTDSACLRCHPSGSGGG